MPIIYAETHERSRRSAGCSTSASPGPASTWRCPGRRPATPGRAGQPPAVPVPRRAAARRHRRVRGGRRHAATGRQAVAARGRRRCRACGTRSLTAAPSASAAAATTARRRTTRRFFDRLRAWRLARSRRRTVPAYVVFTDATLEASPSGARRRVPSWRGSPASGSQSSSGTATRCSPWSPAPMSKECSRSARHRRSTTLLGHGEVTVSADTTETPINRFAPRRRCSLTCDDRPPRRSSVPAPAAAPRGGDSSGDQDLHGRRPARRCAFAHARTRALVIVPTSGVQGDVRPNTDAGKSRAWSPPV